MNQFETGNAVIIDPVGLHARPAVKVSKLAKKYAAAIEVRAEPDGAWVNAKSTNALMKMKAACGSSLFVRAKGEDALHAVAEIVSLIRRGFGDKTDG